MKKYVKPDLYFDNFELSVGVASCGIVMKDGKFVKDTTGDVTYKTFIESVGAFGTGCKISYLDIENYGYYGQKYNFPVHNS